MRSTRKEDKFNSFHRNGRIIRTSRPVRRNSVLFAPGISRISRISFASRTTDKAKEGLLVVLKNKNANSTLVILSKWKKERIIPNSVKYPNFIRWSSILLKGSVGNFYDLSIFVANFRPCMFGFVFGIFRFLGLLYTCQEHITPEKLSVPRQI